MAEAWIYTDPDADGDAAGEVARVLADLGFAPRRVTANGSLRPEGDGVAAGRPPDLALVLGDVGLCARLESDEDLGDVPVLVAVDDEDLESGAVHEGHELVVLPIRPVELRARIARARRRVTGVTDDEVVRVGSLEVNLATYQVAVDGKPVDFTYLEYELLKFLVTHPGRVFSREALLSRVWGFDYYGGARTVDVHVRRVRAKLGTEHAQRIKTVRSVGYLFEGEAQR
ncbi:response regulator transcription factor [Conexibacter sp. SYSU D00693]|uniref:winged helix-turn-helix transcriptional regulator n=1 Tax=Conexibacter sp. SYSU D00693 TaxID=2812560 RepID=UPI00196A3061|nr:response regulator transcription factor [Conexibacter sp. SYSU D00693]